MEAALLALPVILELISKLTPGFMHLLNWVVQVRALARQSAAWTPELEEAFIQSLIATKTNPAYQPDPPSAVPPA